MTLTIEIRNDLPSESAVDEAANDATRVVAQEGFDRVHARLRSVLKHPTGHYQRNIVVNRAQGNWRVTDSNVRYGPWLESGRHRRATRFRGYHTFTLVAQSLQNDAGNIAQVEFDRRL